MGITDRMSLPLKPPSHPLPRSIGRLLLAAVAILSLETNPVAAQSGDFGPMTACGTDALLDRLRADPSYKGREEAMNEAIRAAQSVRAVMAEKGSPGRRKAGDGRQRAGTLPLHTIPIVFHIVGDDPTSVTDQAVIDALAGLNDALAHRNAFGVDTLGSDTRIEFCLASRTPDGKLTSGINRIKSHLGDNDMELEAFKPSSIINWDPDRYTNVWVVDRIFGEIKPSLFRCGTWNRMGVGGYASAGTGAVVGGLSVGVLAHEIGHYLSLLHTFEGLNCMNSDCTRDGDKVCDTPPDRSMSASPCDNPENSCLTDLQSGPFTEDQRDNISNIMDYGSPCPTVFTKGQAERMRAFLEVFNGGSLLASDGCTPPCTGNTRVSFNWNGNPNPKTGDAVGFVNTSTGASNFLWEVDGATAGTSRDLTYTFATDGNHAVRLTAYDSDPACASSLAVNIRTGCGVEARFSPNKRVIASRNGEFLDSVTFINRSVGATTYQWYMTGPAGTGFTPMSTDRDFKHVYDVPGNYIVRLEARNGGCVATAQDFSLKVWDPRADAVFNGIWADCHRNDSIRVTIAIYNGGYDTIPAGMRVSFFDKDPRGPGAVKLESSQFTAMPIQGQCWQFLTYVVKQSSPGQNSIFAHIDDDDAVLENTNSNNIGGTSNFRPSLTIRPADTLVYVNTDFPMRVSVSPLKSLSYSWTPSSLFTCASCMNTTVKVPGDTTVKVFGSNPLGCIDSAIAKVRVYPPDLSVKARLSECLRNDSMIVTSDVCLGNRYLGLESDVVMAYFDADSSLPGARLLATMKLPAGTSFATGCAEVSHRIGMTRTGKVFVYVNRGHTTREDDFSNNGSSVPYAPMTVSLPSNQIEVANATPVTLSIVHKGEPLTAVRWSPSQDLSCSDCPNPVLTTWSSQVIKVRGETRMGCADSAMLAVKCVYQGYVGIPNSFTPNGDAVNDRFYIAAGKEVAVVRRLTVMNRWGETVFSRSQMPPNDRSAGWDGRFKGELAAAGTYVYMAVIELQDGRIETVKGNVTLIR